MCDTDYKAFLQRRSERQLAVCNQKRTIGAVTFSSRLSVLLCLRKWLACYKQANLTKTGVVCLNTRTYITGRVDLLPVEHNLFRRQGSCRNFVITLKVLVQETYRPSLELSGTYRNAGLQRQHAISIASLFTANSNPTAYSILHISHQWDACPSHSRGRTSIQCAPPRRAACLNSRSDTWNAACRQSPVHWSNLQVGARISNAAICKPATNSNPQP